MRQILPIPIVGPTRFARYPKISREATYNMMITDDALIAFPGYSKIRNLSPGSTMGRSIYKSPKYNHGIVVMDNGVFSVNSDFSVAFIGSLDSFSGPVYITENNANEIVISDNSSDLYIFNYQAQTFNKVNIGFRTGYITFQDGYIIAPELDTSRWRLSELNNASSFPDNAQSVGLIQSQPDVVVSCETLQRQLFIFGENITEVWLNVPNPQVPFTYQRQNSLSIEYGCVSPNTIASGFNRLVWLGSNEYSAPSILVSTGGVPRKITTDGIDFELDQLTKPEDSFGFLFEESGHVFYQITFPTDEVSYAYDFNTDSFFNVTDHNLNAHIARKISYFNGRHLFITDKNGGLFEMGTNIFVYKETNDDDDPGFTIPRGRILPNFRLPGSKRFVTDAASLTIEQGYSNDPLKVDLSLSKDGSQTYGSKWTKYLKSMGDRPNKLIYRKLGAANDLSMQFQFWGRDRFVITGGEMEVYK